MSDAMMDAEPMSYEDARRDLGQHGGARREHVIAREADRLRAELDDLERRRAKTPGEGMYLRDKLQIQAAEIDRLRAERDRLAERVGEVVSVCNRADKMMAGEMIVYVSDIRAALAAEPDGGER